MGHCFSGIAGLAHFTPVRESRGAGDQAFSPQVCRLSQTLRTQTHSVQSVGGPTGQTCVSGIVIYYSYNSYPPAPGNCSNTGNRKIQHGTGVRKLKLNGHLTACLRGSSLVGSTLGGMKQAKRQ